MATTGIKVSVLCPQAVRTAMTAGNPDGVASVDGMIEPEDVAEACVRAIEAEDFLVLPHPEVLEYMRRKTGDYDRWIGGMRKLNRKFWDGRFIPIPLHSLEGATSDAKHQMWGSNSPSSCHSRAREPKIRAR